MLRDVCTKLGTHSCLFHRLPLPSALPASCPTLRIVLGMGELARTQEARCLDSAYPVDKGRLWSWVKFSGTGEVPAMAVAMEEMKTNFAGLRAMRLAVPEMEGRKESKGRLKLTGQAEWISSWGCLRVL